MDLKQELDKISKNKNNVNSIINSLSGEREELDKKIHILKVIKIADAIDEIIKNGDFLQTEINYINLLNNYSDDYAYRIMVDVQSKDHRVIYNYDLLNNSVESIKGIWELFRILDGFNITYVNEHFGENKRKIIKLDNSFKEELLDILLSRELKTTLEYYNMEKELSNKDNGSNKKHKV